jgi:arylsulfatase A-like enzyme
MATEGVRLTSFYAQPVCGVSRAALMTGSYPIRVAEPGNVKRLHTVPHPREVTMAEVLEQAGYATGMMGKWHLAIGRKDQPTGVGPATTIASDGLAASVKEDHTDIEIEKRRIDGTPFLQRLVSPMRVGIHRNLPRSMQPQRRRESA